MNKIKNVKTNKKAEKMSMCQISGELCLPSNLVYIDIRKQGTQTINKKYFDYFKKNTNKILANHILTLATYGDCKVDINNNLIIKHNFSNTDESIFQFILKDKKNNNITIDIYGHFDATKNTYKLNHIKGFLNILTNHKDLIRAVKFRDIINGKIEDITDLTIKENINPVKSFVDYHYGRYGLYYNTKNKKTMNLFW